MLEDTERRLGQNRKVVKLMTQKLALKVPTGNIKFILQATVTRELIEVPPAERAIVQALFLSVSRQVRSK